MEEKEKIKCQFILANDNEEIVEVIEGDDILLRGGNQKKLDKCIDNCLKYEEKKLHIKDVKFNCNIRIKFDIDRYDLQSYSCYVADQIDRINRLSYLQEVKALAECATPNIDELIYITSMKEYRFFSNDKQELTFQILCKHMQDVEIKTKLNNEGVYLTTTGIVIFFNKPYIKNDNVIVLDDNKVRENEQIKLKVLIAKEGEDEKDGQWFEFPMQNEKEVRSSINRKYLPDDEIIIKKTWSNCGLIEYKNYLVQNLESYVIHTQEDLVELNEITNIEDVQYFSTMAIDSTPLRILELIKRRRENV